jgi:hypothetical protein
MNQTLTTRSMNGCTPAIQQARQDRLDALYTEDGRHDPAHPLHASYTGLWAQYVGEPANDEPAP